MRRGRSEWPDAEDVPATSDDLEDHTRALGRTLIELSSSVSRGPLRRLDERATRLADEDPRLRAALFRLIDVTPACRSLEDLGRHLAALLSDVDTRPQPLDAAIRVSHTKSGRVALGAATTLSVRRMAHRFIVGETPTTARGELQHLWRAGIANTVDLLGEATATAAEADHYRDRCLDALEAIAEASQRWPKRERLEADSIGALPRTNVSVKISALTPMLRPHAPERAVKDATARLRPLLRRARDLGAHVHIDTEALDSLEATLALVLDLLGEDEFDDGPSAGVVLQAYLCDSPAYLEQILEWAARTPRREPLVVRLVKGAYWDHEIAEARQHGWPAPVFTNKADCDRNFESLTRELLAARPSVRVAVGSHNVRSLAHAIVANRAAGGSDADIEVQVLRGLGDDLATAAARAGLRARVYCPIGDLVAGMSYLVRRLLENTSNASFLKARTDGVDLAELLAAP